MATPDVYEQIANAVRLEDGERLTLREAGRRDPLPGDPLMIDGREVFPGGWVADETLCDENGLPYGCPVSPLGMGVDNETIYVLNTLGSVARLKSNASGKGPIGFLFAGRERWLEWAFPRFGKAPKGGGRPPVMGWEADDARQKLVAACGYKGVFEDVDRVRGRGCWVDELGGLIYHGGDRIWTGGRWINPGEIGDYVYPARAPIMAPWPEAADTGGAADLLMILETWNWSRKHIDARLLLGWICAAMIGGALDWRPMVFLTGDQGTGKSTLQKLIVAVLGRGIVSSVNTSGPGLYQKLRHDTVPVSVDELESEADTRKADEVIKLVRTAASGGRINRGSSEGAAREYECRSAFILSAINHPPLQGQDEARLAVLALRPIEKAATDKLFDGFDAHKVGRGILRRMIDGWPRWAATLKAYRAALIEAGHTGRSADQFGPMLAAGWIALSEGTPDKGELAQWAAWLDPAGLSSAGGGLQNWRQCLNHVLDVQPDAFRTYTRKSLGLYIEEARDKGTGSAIEELVTRARDLGMTVSWPRGTKPHDQVWDNARLFIPATHPEVIKLFAGTQWAGRAGAGGVWTSALQQADQSEAWSGVVGKGLDKERKGTLISLLTVFGPAGQGQEEDA